VNVSYYFEAVPPEKCVHISFYFVQMASMRILPTSPKLPPLVPPA